MRWCMSHRFDPEARVLADRHYSRQKVGSPQFVKPGSCLVLLSNCGRAYWVTSVQKRDFTHHAWAGAWECAAFRSEGAGVASELIRQAVAATLNYFGPPPDLGMVTFINREKIRPIKVRGQEVWGWTFRKAGFVDAGETKSGLLALTLAPSKMPEPMRPKPRRVDGLPLWSAA